jgi:polyphosphate kinase 2 (PPK2 family)
MPHTQRARVMQQLTVEPGRPAALAQRDTARLDAPEYEALTRDEVESEAQAILARDREQLSRAQEQLWASGERSLLVVFQAMDAAGKDSSIGHVMSG